MKIMMSLSAAEASLIAKLRGCSTAAIMIAFEGDVWLVTINDGQTRGGAGKSFNEAWACIEPVVPPPGGDGLASVS